MLKTLLKEMLTQWQASAWLLILFLIPIIVHSITWDRGWFGASAIVCYSAAAIIWGVHFHKCLDRNHDPEAWTEEVITLVRKFEMPFYVLSILLMVGIVLFAELTT